MLTKSKKSTYMAFHAYSTKLELYKVLPSLLRLPKLLLNGFLEDAFLFIASFIVKKGASLAAFLKPPRPILP